MSKDSIPLSPEADQEADDRSENNGELELDASGLYCPEPVMLLHNKIRDMQSGQTLRLTATDPSTTRDVPKFCLYLDHELLESGHEGEIYHYRIRKKVS